jgi:AcrR family transcriptional regulator
MDGVETREHTTRSRIVAAAERLFRTIGYQKTTVADIAKDLAMSPANVYRFFPSKADIRDAVGRLLMTEVENAIAAIGNRPGPAAPRLAEAMRTLNRMNKERYLSDTKMHDMVRAAIDENWGMVVEHVRVMEDLMTKIVADGIASGEFKVTDAGAAARCVKSAMISFCHPQLLEECAAFPEPTIDQMIAFCLASLTLQPYPA